jgi:hypothetical protein
MQVIVDDNFIIILQICIWRISVSLYIVNIENNSNKIFFWFLITVNRTSLVENAEKENIERKNRKIAKSRI